MKNILISVIGCVLCVGLMAGCGDDAVPGFGGRTVCASDDPEVGNMIECPSGTETIDFCVNTSSGNCYYVISGDRIDCGDCFGSGDINACAQEAAERCD